MRRFARLAGPALAVALGCGWLAYSQLSSASQTLLWQRRNLGKAFYENPTMAQQAVEQFRLALALAPNSARERLNYGLALLRGGDMKNGMAELERVQKQDPKLPHTWFNLGIAYKKLGEFDKAQAEFEEMVRLAPDEPASHYQLGALYKPRNRRPPPSGSLRRRAISIRGWLGRTSSFSVCTGRPTGRKPPRNWAFFRIEEAAGRRRRSGGPGVERLRRNLRSYRRAAFPAAGSAGLPFGEDWRRIRASVGWPCRSGPGWRPPQPDCVVGGPRGAVPEWADGGRGLGPRRVARRGIHRAGRFR